MRVIMGYMYKDHLDVDSYTLLPTPLVQSLLLFHIQAVLSTICIQTVSSTSSSNQLLKRIKRREKGEKMEL